MAFDTRSFVNTEFVQRTQELRLPELAKWFDGEPLWIVRGLTSSELAKTLDAANRQRSIDTIIKSIAQNESMVAELRQTLGISDDTPQDIIKRLEQLTIASVEPKIDFTVAVKLAEVFPIEFYMLTNAIVSLTGQGMDIKKSLPSGETQPSEMH
jgi:hypothetical protein